ncbi:hypothetical protein FOZ61_001547 [Perkinsus olseni]|uniref:Uncharacterized protein n=1 Tax=Perkinsus olseni TaxID=32597 RepID=A0A7J6LWB0_PEROL|nr:hypothetical protein FOZ61_001547 [Perkinsus olseni]
MGVDYPCRGVPGVVSELEWEQVKHFASNWHLPDVLSPTTIRSLERHYTFSNLLTRLIEQDDAYETGRANRLESSNKGKTHFRPGGSPSRLLAGRIGRHPQRLSCYRFRVR